MAFGQPRANKSYSFNNEHVVSLFKLLQKSNRLKLLEIKRPKEVGKTEIPTTVYITEYWGTLSKIATFLKMSFRL